MHVPQHSTVTVHLVLPYTMMWHAWMMDPIPGTYTCNYTVTYIGYTNCLCTLSVYIYGRTSFAIYGYEQAHTIYTHARITGGSVIRKSQT